MNKKICIVGGNGFIGSKYTQLTSKKKNILIFDKKIIRNKKKNIKYVYGDCLSKNTFKKIPNDIDVIIFMVGQVGGPESLNVNVLEKYFENNCQTLVNFLENIQRMKIKKIIFFSTEHVYGDKQKNTSNNLHIEPQPKNYYGITKLLCEKILKNFYDRYKISIDILRFPRVIDQGDRSLLSNIVSTVLKKKILKIDETNTKFNFIYIDDLVKAIDCCLSKMNTGFRVLNIFNCDKPISLKQIIKIIKKNFKIQITVEKQKKSIKPNHNPSELIINNKKFIKDEINWIASFDNKDIIKKIYFHELNKYN